MVMGADSDGAGLAARAGAALRAGDRAGAVRDYRAASRLEGDTLRGALLAARASIVAEQPVEAQLRRTLKRFPESGAAWGMLGTALAEAGRIAEARACFASAIARDPAQIAYHYDLARSGGVDGQRAAIVAGLARTDLSSMQRVALNLARGTLDDAAGDSAGAAAAWLAAAELGEAAVAYDRDAVANLTAAVIAGFDADTIAALRPAALPTTLPLLIVGLPRSGTTLVEALLGNHPAIAPGGERDALMQTCAAAPLPPTPGGADALAVDLRASWLKQLRALARPATRHVTDKLPHNYFWLGWVAAILPGVRIVHVRRDPRDVMVSILGTYFGRQPTFPARPGDIVAHIRAYQRVMAHWRGVLPPEQLYEVDYEALVADPDATMRPLTDWLGLPWHASCARTGGGAPIRSASKYQARRAIDGGSVGRWRRYAEFISELADLSQP